MSSAFSLLRTATRAAASSRPLVRLSARAYSAQATPAAEPAAPAAEVPDKNIELLEQKDKLIAELKVRPALPRHFSSISFDRSQDSRLRALADFENLQKITTREKIQAKDFALTSFARDLISSIDILSLALGSIAPAKLVSSEGVTANPDLVGLYEGVTMTKKEIERVLKRHGVVPFNPVGQQFDPNIHEALYQAPVPGKTPGEVLECQEIGCAYPDPLYVLVLTIGTDMIKDRLLRPAKVGVVLGEQ